MVTLLAFVYTMLSAAFLIYWLEVGRKKWDMSNKNILWMFPAAVIAPILLAAITAIFFREIGLITGL